MGVRESRQLDIPSHRAFVRRHNCSVSSCDRLPIEAAHFDGPIPNEDRGGMSAKDHDRWCFPLCRWHHTGPSNPMALHTVGWSEFDRFYGIDSKKVAEAMWRESPARIRLEAKQRKDAK